MCDRKKCKIICRSTVCYDLHIQRSCVYVIKCDVCLGVIKKKQPHVCLEQKLCRNYKTVVAENHLCYMKTQKEVDDLANKTQNKMKHRNAQFAQEQMLDYEQENKSLVVFDFEIYI